MILRLAPIFGLLLTFSICASFANADIIILENRGAASDTTGDLLDNIGAAEIGTMAATVPVVEIPGLTLTVTGINSDAPTTNPVLNSLSTSFGVNADGDSDSDVFEAEFNQSVTFQFDQDVEIKQLDFTNFTAGEEFEFAGTLIENGDLSNGTTDVFDFGTPLEILANTSFTLEATAGNIGIEGIHVTVISVPEPSALALLGLASLGMINRRRR